MNMSNIGKQERTVFIGLILKSLLCAYIVTGIFLLLLTLLLFKMNLDEGKISAGITLVYVISTFSGGFVAGKLAKVKRFLWGAATGITYFILLLFISLVLYRSFQDNVMNIFTTLCLCMGGGMLGGMVS